MKQKSGYHYYKADTPGFSLFAIGAKKSGAEEPAETTETTGEETTGAAEETPTKEETNVWPFVLVLVVLIVIAGIVYFVLHKKNR